MLDVIPPSPSGVPLGRDPAQPGKRLVGRRRWSQPTAPDSSTAPRVVQLTWRLPARLRRPIRDELTRERQRTRRRQSIVQFERRPIYSSLPSAYPTYRGVAKSKQEHRGAESHTGDVYRYSKPTVQLPMPPYQGRARAPRLRPPDIARPTVPPPAKPHSAPRVLKISPARAPSPKPMAARDRSFLEAKAGPRTLPRQQAGATAPAWPAGRSKPTFANVTADRSDKPFKIEVDGRDAPYQWPNATQRVPSVSVPEQDVELVPLHTPAKKTLNPPRRRFALPLHFSIFPRTLLPWRRASQAPSRKVQVVDSGFPVNLRQDQIDAALRRAQGTPSQSRSEPVERVKKKIFERASFNIVMLAIGCAACSVLVASFYRANQGLVILSSLREKAAAAYEHVSVAQAALIDTDFEASEKEFAEAEKLLTQARADLTAALSTSKVVLEYLDVTGTVRSGDKLLVAGEQLAMAGQNLSRGLAPLMQADFFAGDGQAEPTVTDSLTTSFAELQKALMALKTAEAALSQVQPRALPDDIAPQVIALQGGVPKISASLESFLDQSDLLLQFLGAERSRQYLLVFQNNHELRPTGGFIGSIALVNIDRGVVEEIDVQTVYDPDGQLTERIAPPAPLLPITDRWYLRDANWFIDYNLSAEKIMGFFEKEGGSTVDGVIALTPDVIVELLKITGPIEVPAYDLTVDANNFVKLTQDQVTYSYDRELNQPKKFLADLTPLLLNRLLSSKDDSVLPLLSTLQKLLHEKNVLVHFSDSQLQAAVHEAGWDGSLPPASQGFLAVNNANIGGHKSDQFIEQEIDYRTEVKDTGDVDVVLTVRRTHRGPDAPLDAAVPAGENPAFKDNIVYQRVLVPKGAELVEAQGFSPASMVPRQVFSDEVAPLTADPDLAEWQRVQVPHASATTVGTEAGYTSFANWVITKPGATTVTLYRYRIPQHAALPGLLATAQRYSIVVAKQPGDMHTTLRSEVRVPPGFKLLHTEPPDGVTETTAESFVYRGRLISDRKVGAVFAKQ